MKISFLSDLSATSFFYFYFYLTSLSLQSNRLQRPLYRTRYTAPATPHPLQRTHYTAPTHAHAHTQDVQPYSLRYCPVPIRPEGEDRVGDQKGRLQRKTSRSPAPLPCSSSVCTCSCPAVLAAAAVPAAATFLPDSGILLCTRILLTDLTELPDHSPLTS